MRWGSMTWPGTMKRWCKQSYLNQVPLEHWPVMFRPCRAALLPMRQIISCPFMGTLPSRLRISSKASILPSSWEGIKGVIMMTLGMGQSPWTKQHQTDLSKHLPQTISADSMSPSTLDQEGESHTPQLTTHWGDTYRGCHMDCMLLAIKTHEPATSQFAL